MIGRKYELRALLWNTNRDDIVKDERERKTFYV